MTHHSRMHHRWIAALRSSWSTFVLVVCAVLFVALNISHPREGDAAFVSPEMWFTDASAGGLQIVPASGGSVIGSPTIYGYQCYSNGTVTVSWSAVSGAMSYQPRYHYSYIGCPSGWFSANPYECDLNGYTSTSVNFPISYDQGYEFWVHAYDGTTSNPASISFSCPSSSGVTCTFAYSPTTLYPGDTLNATWTSVGATSRTNTLYKNGAYFGGPWDTPLSGTVAVAYDDVVAQVGYGTFNRIDTVTAPSGSGNCQSTVVVVPPGPPACTLYVSPSQVNQPASSTLSWESHQATTFYISNVSYVTPNQAGSTSVAPSATTAYTGTAVNSYGTTTCATTLSVNRSCSFDGTTVTHGSSVTAYQASTVPYGSSCVSQTRTCTDGTLSGSYAYSSCSVASPASCTLDGVTVAHGDSRTFYAQQTTSGGQLCSDVALVRSCDNGTLSGGITGGSYQYANCSCAASYSCSGSTITYTDASCNTSNVATCTSPSYCSAGTSSCVWPPISYNASGNLTGHLQARPSILRSGANSTLYWDVANAVSCTVSGGGQTWNTTSSGASGVATNPITEKTTYTLSCTAGGTNSNINETLDVLIQPNFQEQ